MSSREVAIASAVRAYCLARRRAALQKKGMVGRKAAKQLADEFPQAYSSHGPASNLVFIGTSADDIIEDYVAAQAAKSHREERRGGNEWARLCAIVIWRGGREE